MMDFWFVGLKNGPQQCIRILNIFHAARIQKSSNHIQVYIFVRAWESFGLWELSLNPKP